MAIKMSAALREPLRQLTLYLPLVLMALLALGSWWISRISPTPSPLQASVTEAAPRLEPDYYLTRFSVKNFDAKGTLVSELFGQQAQHVPATDMLEIQQAHFRAVRAGATTVGRADRAWSTGDGSEVTLVGNAQVVRQADPETKDKPAPRTEFRSEFLQAFIRTDVLMTDKPVSVLRGADQFSADAMVYNKQSGSLQLDGRVRVRFEASSSP